MFPAHLGTGQTIDLDSPSLASEVLYDHAYVAARNNAGYRIPAGNMNLYAYVRNNPLNAVDPSGLADCGTTRPSLEGKKCTLGSHDDDRVMETIHCINIKGQKTTKFCCLQCMINLAAEFDRKLPRFTFRVVGCRETPTAKPCSPWDFVEYCFPSVKRRRFELEREKRRFETEQPTGVWRLR